MRGVRLGTLVPVNETTPVAPAKSLLLLQMVRAVCHLAIVLILTFWAVNAWPLPWPGLLAGAGALVITVLIWALFLSPRPVLRTDRFGQALIELLLIGAAVAALLALGTNWILAAVLGIAAAAVGFIASSPRAK